MTDDDTKQCPFCAETIKAAAIVCRFCNRDVVELTEPDPPEGASPVAQEDVEGEASLLTKVARYAFLFFYAVAAVFLVSRENQTVAFIGMGMQVFLLVGVVAWALWRAARQLTEGARLSLAVIAVLALGLITLPLPGDDGLVRLLVGLLLFVAAAVTWDIGMKPVREAELLIARRVCLTCGTISVPQRALKGSVWITLLLLIFGILPGVIYMAYRRSGRKRGELRVCPECQSRDLVPLGTPAAQHRLGE